MPRHEPLSDDEIEMRSVLMRLYHSRQMGEDFYPAAFVNGHAPQMEADGWIERCGQGWRLTDAGLKVWAGMNAHILDYKFQYGQKMFDEMRDALKGEEEVKKTCLVEGCEEPRMVSSKGEVLQRCEKHQREMWRENAAKHNAKKKAAKAETMPQQIICTDLSGHTVEVVEPAKPVTHDCETCYAKGVIDALRAKSPKLAALIEAMEAEHKAAFELGL